jgi:hypothetical protein
MTSLRFLLAASVAATLSASEALALGAPDLRGATAPSAVKAAHGRRGGGLFGNWCAYNCTRVSPCARRGGCYGRYHYSHYRYDEDLPFRYRYDRDASAIDNGLGVIYPITGEWLMRAFERRY